MKIQIKKRYTGSVIFEADAESIGGAICAALATGADLSGADLRGADLAGAKLYGAKLYGADLRGADLYEANLYGADLRGADLRGADLRGADLRGANLYEAYLYGATIPDDSLASLVSVRTILPDGDLIGWKKLAGGVICKLRIPADARRVGGLIGRKCRAEYAVVLEGAGMNKRDGESKSLRYVVGETVRPDNYDPDPRVECSNGIHFFITRAEAEAYW